MPQRKPKLSVRARRLGISIRRVKNTFKGEKFGYSWQVTLPSRVTGGKRIRKQFKATESREAVRFAEGKASTSKETGHSGFKLTFEQQADAIAVLKLLEPHQISLKEAAECAIRHLRPEGGDKTFLEVQELLLGDKRDMNRRRASLQSLGWYVKAIVSHFGSGTLIKTTTADALREWIDSLKASGVSDRHRRNFVTYSKQFFRYAHARRFIGENPAVLLGAPHVETRPPTILTIPEVRRLLQTVMTTEHAPLLPSVVLGLFCGLRTEELNRLKWEAVDLARRKITISPDVGKNRGAEDWRYPSIPPAAVKWLLLHSNRSGSIAPTRFHNRLTALHAAAGFDDWKETHANSKRHSFGSYYCKLHGIDRTIEQMGNSVRMFVKHYQNSTVTKRQAGQFFKLTPATVDETLAEVVPIKSTATG